MLDPIDDEGKGKELHVSMRQKQLLSLVEHFLAANEVHLFLEMCCWCVPLKEEFVQLFMNYCADQPKQDATGTFLSADSIRH